MPCYVTGDSQNAALIGIYDIFGLSPQVSIYSCVVTPRLTGCYSLPPQCLSRSVTRSAKLKVLCTRLC